MATPDAGEERVLSAIEKLDDRLRNMQAEISQRFDTLSERFMPRAEQLQRFDEMARQIIRAEEDIKQINSRLDVSEERRVVALRYVATNRIALITLAVSVLVIIIAHWK